MLAAVALQVEAHLSRRHPQGRPSTSTGACGLRMLPPRGVRSSSVAELLASLAAGCAACCALSSASASAACSVAAAHLLLQWNCQQPPPPPPAPPLLKPPPPPPTPPLPGFCLHAQPPFLLAHAARLAACWPAAPVPCTPQPPCQPPKRAYTPPRSHREYTSVKQRHKAGPSSVRALTSRPLAWLFWDCLTLNRSGDCACSFATCIASFVRGAGDCAISLLFTNSTPQTLRSATPACQCTQIQVAMRIDIGKAFLVIVAVGLACLWSGRLGKSCPAAPLAADTASPCPLPARGLQVLTDSKLFTFSGFHIHRCSNAVTRKTGTE